MQNRIEEKLHSAFDLEYLKLENESYRHNVPPGSESHFKAVLVSLAFTGLMPVKRHQMVYGVLSEELQAGVHALALHTYTPAEWEEVQRRYPNSPDCLGGNGK
ncbi:BolA/IbaG family iron-sulfur metabolism protein [Sansalvadorimonas sp. 2012CJ34-2]|uniref:BolA/IbaG family iron-sulfur metabolism protein n=1 Tax=Parendozoicomonas callyspongiae TaxID=2942213 RepID=A0ABT0PHQ5_9GAMM|nr:BolA/IbaG family iron-sulfur metabolism protein [Sansalvadorimonas sp. 2012CJ34-2]MCL6270920.1 BolA/IbaG family iron-sulfur metabolism protein [Sansalvadorimonas sp. 2012CJ34-2]